MLVCHFFSPLFDKKILLNLILKEANEYYDEASKHDYGDKVKKMEIDLKDLLFRLLDKRRTVKRIHDVDVSNLCKFCVCLKFTLETLIIKKMSRDEMQAEKIDTQKELLTFEAVNVRPVCEFIWKKDFY